VSEAWPPEGPSPEELMAQLAERLGRTPVPDVLLQTMATFTDMAGIRLGLGPQGDGPRDLAQARLAIECLRALAQVAEDELPGPQGRVFQEPLAQLQLAFARVAGAAAPAGPEAEAPPPGAEERPPAEPPPPPPPPHERDAASRLWVPPSARRPR